MSGDKKNIGPISLADLRALRGNFKKSLRKRRLLKLNDELAENIVPVIKADFTSLNKLSHGNKLLLASYNIHKCVGTDKIFNPERIIDVITEINPDILALQEIDKRFKERNGLLNLEYLQKQTGLTPVPIHTTVPQGQGWFGNALFLKNGKVCAIEQLSLPGMEPRGALITDIHFKAGWLRVVSAHFGLLRRSRALQVETILSTLKNKQPMPTIFVGDLNEWRIGENSSLNNLNDYFIDKTEVTASFPSRFPLLALDRAFSNHKGLVQSISVHDSERAQKASDHLPLRIQLNLDA